MLTIAPKKASQLCNLPDTLNMLILEYLPFKDFYNTSLTCKKIYMLVQKSSNLWGRHLFKKFLDPFLKAVDRFEDELFSEPSSFYYDGQFFQNMVDPKRFLRKHFIVKEKWCKFFSEYMPVEKYKQFVGEIFNAICAPQSPFPCLKRDIHHFPTNTMFQNFLTEVYFQVHNRKSKDKNFMFVESLMKEIKATVEEPKFNHINLLKLMGFNSRTLEERVSNNQKFNENNERKLKRIKLNRLLIKQERRHPKAIFKFISNRPRANPKMNKALQQVGLQKVSKNRAEKLYSLVYLLIKSHTQIVWSYLVSLRESCILLREYTRIWNNFVMLMIEFNHILYPILDYMKGCQDTAQTLNSENFAIWKLMVQTWINEVYSKLDDSLNDAFSSLFINSCLKPKTSNFDTAFTEDSMGNINEMEVIPLAQEFYNSVSDLSFNEFTVFFWRCLPCIPGTPKEKLDLKILQDTEIFYQKHEPLSSLDFLTVKHLFEEGLESVERIFGIELQHQIIELQVSFLKNSLFRYCKSVVDLIKNSSVLDPSSMKSNDFHQRFIDISSILIGDQNTRLNDQDVQNRVRAAVLKSFPSFDSYVILLKHLEENLEMQRQNFERKKAKLIKTGFKLGGSGYEIMLNHTVIESCEKKRSRNEDLTVDMEESPKYLEVKMSA